MTCGTCAHPADVHSKWAGCTQPGDNHGTFCTCNQFVPIQHGPVPLNEAIREVRASWDLPEPVATVNEPQLVTDDDIQAGRAARDEGAAIAGSGVPMALAAAWRDSAQIALAGWIKSGRTFTANDIREAAGDPPVPAMLGALFLHYSQRGDIVPAGWITTGRKPAHARPLRVWKAAP